MFLAVSCLGLSHLVVCQPPLKSDLKKIQIFIQGFQGNYYKGKKIGLVNIFNFFVHLFEHDAFSVLMLAKRVPNKNNVDTEECSMGIE